ncbi:MAG: hypothetical protein J6I34_00360 [Prevotella sp.]|nr:hypothetical protein [Prevotella sp.]
MKQFSFNRFRQLLLSYMADNSKRLLILCGGLYAATLVMFTIGMLAGATLPTEQSPDLELNVKVLGLLMGIGYANNVSGLAMMVILTRVFANIESRTGDIQFLMLPATTLEKWLSRVVYVILVGCVLTTAVSYAAMLTWCGVASLMGFEDAGLLMTIMFHPFQAVEMTGLPLPSSLFFLNSATTILEVAFFIYGGTVFRHYAWLKSIAIFFAVVMVIGIGFGTVMCYDIISDINVSGEAAVTKEAVREAVSMTRYSGLFLWTGIVMCVLSPVFIFLSYRRFGKRELESRKYNIVAA